MCCSARGLALEPQPISNVALLKLIRVTDSGSVVLSIIGATGGQRERERERGGRGEMRVKNIKLQAKMKIALLNKMYDY